MASAPPSNARRRRRWPYVLAGLALLGAGAAVAVYLIFFQKEGNYSNPNAAFESTPQGPPPKKTPKPEPLKCPIYASPPARPRSLATSLHPPFKKLWKFHKGQDRKSTRL